MEQAFIPYQSRKSYGLVTCSKVMKTKSVPGKFQKLYIQDWFSPLSVKVFFAHVERRNQATHVAVTIFGQENDAQKQYVVLYNLKNNQKTILNIPEKAFDNKYQFLKLELAEKQKQNKPT